uniref:Putative flagellar biosynthesis protein FliH n=1 Tax=mine drainage metagenome TaxID=410659 RepID=E6Q199_9ZZZZ
MGKIVRGARLVEEAYRVGVPDARIVGELAEESTAPSLDAADEVGETELRAVPQEPTIEVIDWESLRTEATAALERAKNSAREILEGAFRTASSLLDQGRREREAIAEAARGEGHEAGRQEGIARVDAEMNELLGLLHGIIDAVREDRDRFLRSAEPELVRLALGASERIVHHEISQNDQFVVETVRSALTRAVARNDITIRVNPEDMAVMREYRERLVAAGDFEHLRLIEDQRIDRGGAVLESDSGTVDAKIATQLREVRSALVPSDELPEITATAS